MKKLILIFTVLLFSIGIFAQTGTGWAQQRAKINFKDSLYFSKAIYLKGATSGHTIIKIDNTAGGTIVIPASDNTDTLATKEDVRSGVGEGGGTMIYPGAGIAISTGSAWGASLTNSSTNWNTAYTDRLKWDGGSTDLVSATGRTSLGGTTVGQAFFIMTNPSAITFPRINADNSVTTRSAAELKTDLSLENVTNESKATMFTSPTLTGTVTIPTPFTLGATSVTSNGTELNYLDNTTGTTGTGNLVLSASPTITGHPTVEGVTSTGAAGTGNIVFSVSPELTGTVTLPTTTSIGDVSSTEIGYLNNVTSAIQTQLSVTTVPTQISDSIAARLAAATVGVALKDSNDYAPYHYATPSFVKSFVGSGTSLTGKRLQFIADVTTGAPEAGDTILIHSNFINKHVDIYRDGAKQYKNFTATNTVEGYRIRSGSDTIYVNPAFQANEQIIVDMIEPINWEFISVKGQDLLDGLVAYYKFDETSGTSLTDEIGGNTATLDGDINQTGIINQAVGLTANNDDIVIPYSEGVTLGESEQFSVSMWFYAEDLPSTIGRAFLLFQQNNSSSPLAPHRASIGSNTDKIYFIVNTDAPSDINVVSADAITADAWHHVVFVCPGSGGSLQIWLDGVDVSTSAQTVNGNLRDGDQYLCVGNAYNAATTAFYGKIDEFAIYNKVLTESEILKLYNSGSGNQYPFE